MSASLPVAITLRKRFRFGHARTMLKPKPPLWRHDGNGARVELGARVMLPNAAVKIVWIFAMPRKFGPTRPHHASRAIASCAPDRSMLFGRPPLRGAAQNHEKFHTFGGALLADRPTPCAATPIPRFVEIVSDGGTDG